MHPNLARAPLHSRPELPPEPPLDGPCNFSGSYRCLVDGKPKRVTFERPTELPAGWRVRHGRLRRVRGVPSDEPVWARALRERREERRVRRVGRNIDAGKLAKILEGQIP